jgi:hypothetical protein
MLWAATGRKAGWGDGAPVGCCRKLLWLEFTTEAQRHRKKENRKFFFVSLWQALRGILVQLGFTASIA